MKGLPWIYDDGGRADAGYPRKKVGDCVTRAVAIASQTPYELVVEQIRDQAMERERSLRSSPVRGVWTQAAWFRPWMEGLGGVWTPTMFIGSGCRVHLRRGELPNGRLVVNISKHMAAVIDGTVYDLYDPCRRGTRCVYGFWTFGGS